MEILDASGTGARFPMCDLATLGNVSYWDIQVMSEYFNNIKKSVATLKEGMKLTLGYLFDARERRAPIGVEDPDYFEQDRGTVTLQYPFESFPVPDNGRYRLHNEIDDCIVCDKCAKVCPVNCIDIEPIRSSEEIGKTSDGTPKRLYAAKFDIDMAKCCYCGLCTTVCPTECLTMTKVYDFSEFDVEQHNYAFSEMTPLEILEKKQDFERVQKEKEAARAASSSSDSSSPSKPGIAKPRIGAAKPVPGKAKPRIGKPILGKKEGEGEASTEGAATSEKAKPMISRPKIGNKGVSEESKEGVEAPQTAGKSKPTKPIIKKPATDSSTADKPKPVIARPKITKPKIDSQEPPNTPTKGVGPEQSQEQAKAPKPVIKQPTVDPSAAKPKFRPRPIVKRKKDDE
ncbi:MAG: 4Fe-4S dicluster domain-containing protein [Bacteroidota bacterium]